MSVHHEPNSGAAPAADPSGLAKAIGHDFKNPSLLADALTHPSLMGLERTARGGGRPDHGPGLAYERLEFLGDRVLGLVIAEWLLERFPDEREGALAKRHASLVRREALARVADDLELGSYLRLSPAEAQSGGRNNRTILGDACEATIGALYLDGGMDIARNFIRRAWTDQIERVQPPPMDAKTSLQEWAQARGKPLPAYKLIEQTGPAHEPLFKVSVTVEGMDAVIGAGSSKRIAEKQAATALLSQLGVKVDD